MQYFVVKNRKDDYVVKLTKFGANSEIVATFTDKHAAMTYVDRQNSLRNKKIPDPIVGMKVKDLLR